MLVDPKSKEYKDDSEGSIEEIIDEVSQSSSKKSITSGFSDSEQSREQEFITNLEQGRDLNPLLIIETNDFSEETISELFSMLSEICSQGVRDTEKLHYFDLSFGRTGVYRLESYFDKEQSEAKKILRCRRKPAYRLFCYDVVTKKLYSELDKQSLAIELEKIKNIVPEGNEKLIQFINLIENADKNETKEYEFWRQQLASQIPEKIDIDRNHFGQSLQNFNTSSFFSKCIKAYAENIINPTICIFHDSHSVPLIPNVVLKLIVDSDFASKKFLYLECFNNNYQPVLDELSLELEKQQKSANEVLEKLKECLYISIVGNTIDMDSHPALNVKAALIVECMQKGIKPIAIDIATDTTRQFDNTQEDETKESSKETRLKLGDPGFVYFIKNSAPSENGFGIALFGSDHVKTVKSSLAAHMKVFDIVVSANQQMGDWKVSCKSADFPEITADLFLTVPLDYEFIQKMPRIPIQIIVSEGFRESPSNVRNRNRSPGQ